MYRMEYDYTKSILERVSFDADLFEKELKKAIVRLLPFEIEKLKNWLLYFISIKPELKQCLLIIKK